MIFQYTWPLVHDAMNRTAGEMAVQRRRGNRGTARCRVEVYHSQHPTPTLRCTHNVRTKSAFLPPFSAFFAEFVRTLCVHERTDDDG